MFLTKFAHLKFKITQEMTKAELVNTISNKLGTEKNETQKVVEAFMQEIRTSMYNGDNVYLRGFGSFIVKTRAAKTGRNISKNTAIEIPAHNIPAFKPSKSFVEKVKTKVAVK
ncbi:HU family DNA-binding protein [Chryseobacterium sp. Leaf394]|nr:MULTISPECIES: HU family DNA-binding protein [unclassified Chryseobacterium]